MDWFLYDRDLHHERVKLISLFTNGLTHCLMIALVNGIGLYMGELIIGRAYR